MVFNVFCYNKTNGFLFKEQFMKHFSLMLITLLLSACSWLFEHAPAQPAQYNQPCQELRDKIILNSVSNVSTIPGQSGFEQNYPTQRAMLYQQYEYQYRCEEKLHNEKAIEKSREE
jgi:hypothetical protein